MGQRLSKADMEKAEALAREIADNLLDSFRKEWKAGSLRQRIKLVMSMLKLFSFGAWILIREKMRCR